MFGVKCPLSFTQLVNQYKPGCYLVETKCGPEFRSTHFRLFRCFEHAFTGTSFHLERSGPSLIKKATALLDQKDPPEEELKNATKVLFLTKRMLRTVPPQKGSTKFDFPSLYAEEKSTASRALTMLAEKRRVSELKLCLEFGTKYDMFLEEAYEQVKTGASLVEIPPEGLNALATIAQQKRDPEMLLHIIALGGVPSACSKDEQHEILNVALSQANEKAILTLINGKFHFEFTLSQPPTPFIFACAEQGMIQAVKCMLEKGASPNQQDEEGNTLLHYAFLLGNTELARILSKVVDTTIKNDVGRTPLACLLKTDGEIALRLKAKNPSPLDFLEAFLVKGPHGTDRVAITYRGYRGSIRDFLQTYTLPRCGDVELGFLLADDEISKILFRNVPRKDFDDACEILAKKYSSHVVERFMLSTFSLTDAHYKTGCEILSLPKNIDLYSDPYKLLTFLDGEQGFSREDRENLKEYLDNVKERKAFVGTPAANSPALKDFYRIIETNLKHIVFTLDQKRDPRLTTKTLKEFIAASQKCGGRYYAVAQLQAQEVCLSLKSDPLSSFQRSLASFRNICLEGIISDIYHSSLHNVHYYTTALRDLGGTLGIPGNSDRPQFNDIYAPRDFDARVILETFRKTYTPLSIVKDWILPQLMDDIDFRNMYIDLQKELVPESWVVPGNPTPTREEKIQDFLGRFVYDEENKLRPSAVRFLLERLDILRCSVL